MAASPHAGHRTPWPAEMEVKIMHFLECEEGACIGSIPICRALHPLACGFGGHNNALLLYFIARKEGGLH
jgi:hypothetical protein